MGRNATRQTRGWIMMRVWLTGEETIQQLAVRYLGAASRWAEIAQLNRLDAPFISPDAATYKASGLNVLGSEDQISIPSTADVSTPDLFQAESEAYGVDLAWDSELLGLIPQGVGFAWDRGIENLRKKVIRAILTRRGDLVHRPEVGNKAWDYVGEDFAPWKAEAAALETKAAVLAIKQITAVDVVAEFGVDGALSMQLQCYTDDQTITLNDVRLAV